MKKHANKKPVNLSSLNKYKIFATTLIFVLVMTVGLLSVFIYNQSKPTFHTNTYESAVQSNRGVESEIDGHNLKLTINTGDPLSNNIIESKISKVKIEDKTIKFDFELDRRDGLSGIPKSAVGQVFVDNLPSGDYIIEANVIKKKTTISGSKTDTDVIYSNVKTY